MIIIIIIIILIEYIVLIYFILYQLELRGEVLIGVDDDVITKQEICNSAIASKLFPDAVMPKVFYLHQSMRDFLTIIIIIIIMIISLH
jgi:hypothetical protein